MNRYWLRSLGKHMHGIRERWYARPFRGLLTDSRLWTLQRRSITGAFASGLAICFVPLPVHVPLAIIVAVFRRLNLPVILATVFLVNPLTVVPMYYLAYRVGAAVLGFAPAAFRFSLSWDWVQNGLGPMWKPFLLGCALCALASSLLGWFMLEWIWQRRVRHKYRVRRATASRKSAAIDENPTL